MDDQDTRQKEPDPHATNPLQEHVELQLYALSLSHYHIKLLKTTLRHHCSKLCELSGQHTVLRELATQRKHELPGPDAHQGHHPKNPGDEDKEFDGLLQLPDGDSGI